MAPTTTGVGVVIPVHGWAPYLAEALDSVLAEDPAEVVVVDDGSPDPLVLHPDHAPRVRLVRREQAGGPAAARNAGIAVLAPGIELIAFCDADDAWEPGSLAPRVAALEQDPVAAGAFGRARIVGPDGLETGERWEEPPPGRLEDVVALYAHNPVLTSSVLLRRETRPVFAAEYSPAEDLELWLRLLRAGRALTYVRDAVVRYRRHPGGLTADVTSLARAQHRLHEDYADLVPATVRTRALAGDRAGEAAGLLRDGRPRDARALVEPGVKRTLLSVPGVRSFVGRRDPYRRRRG